MSESRHELGDFGLAFTLGATFPSLQRNTTRGGKGKETRPLRFALPPAASVGYSQRFVRCCGGRRDVQIQYGGFPSLPWSIRGFRRSGSAGLPSRSYLRGLKGKGAKDDVTAQLGETFSHDPRHTGNRAGGDGGRLMMFITKQQMMFQLLCVPINTAVPREVI